MIEIGDELKAVVRRIVKENGVIGTRDSGRQIKEAALVTTPDVNLRHIVAA